jgi:hypothetical protein
MLKSEFSNKKQQLRLRKEQLCLTVLNFHLLFSKIVQRDSKVTCHSTGC